MTMIELQHINTRLKTKHSSMPINFKTLETFSSSAFQQTIKVSELKTPQVDVSDPGKGCSYTDLHTSITRGFPGGTRRYFPS